ncbi:MAG: helix-turn-helix domain-containing protein [Chromatiales bacterium]|nr:helix-turn-helix domain-containing protein [Chromatiales bacterium]
MQTSPASALPGHLQHRRAKRLTRTQAAEYLGIKPKTLAVWASTGRYALPFLKVGRLAFYELDDLDAFIAARKRQHA